MTFKSLTVAAAALLASVGASAQTSAVFDLTSGSFANAYTFTVTGPATVMGDTSSSGISWFGALLQAPANSYTAFDTNPDDGFSFSGLSAGTYALTFLGSGIGGYGGYYTVSEVSKLSELSELSAVPEPESYALLLAGVGMVGFVAARRHRG